jgi:hypothetical protein
MADLLNQFTLWPKKFSVPIKAHITDVRVVTLYNVSRYLAWVAACLVFIFVFKSYATPARTDLTTNAFMWEPTAEEFALWKSEPRSAYCDNRDYDFTYSPEWVYENITCRMLPSSAVFSKGAVPGFYFVATMLQNDHEEFCDRALENCTEAGVRFKRREFIFPERVEERTITLQVTGMIPDIGYDSSHLAVDGENSAFPSIYILMPNGTRTMLPEGTDPNNINWKIGEMMRYFDGVELDQVNPAAAIGESKGTPRNRIVGLAFVFDIVMGNMEPHFGALPGDVYFEFRLKLERQYQRVTLPPAPTQEPGQQRVTDQYGMRIVTRKLTSEVLTWNTEAAFSSIVRVVVFFQITKILVSLFVLNCIGHYSERWKRSINTHIDHYVLLNRDNTVRIKLRERSRGRAEQVLAKLGREILKDNVGGGGGGGGHKRELMDMDGDGLVSRAERIFAELDIDGDGVCTIQEFKQTLAAHNFVISDSELDALIDVLDRDGSGGFEVEELNKSILKAVDALGVRGELMDIDTGGGRSVVAPRHEKKEGENSFAGVNPALVKSRRSMHVVLSPKAVAKF